MKKWYDEEYVFTVEVTGFLRGTQTVRMAVRSMQTDREFALRPC